MAVVDASVLVNAFVDGGDDGREARAALRRHDTFSAPDLLDAETLSGLRNNWQRARITDDMFERAVADLRAMPIRRLPMTELLGRAFELRHTVSSYDAMYVALAEGLDEPLITADMKLASATGPRCSFEVLGR